jgi:hypothetical protein
MIRKFSATSLMAVSLLSAFAFAGDKDKSVSSITITVVREWNGKPVRNAAVILAQVDKSGKQYGGLNLKSDAEGVVKYEGVPYGKLRVQVIAQGMQTHGEDIVIDEPKEELNIKMKKPQDQHSIYETKPVEKK